MIASSRLEGKEEGRIEGKIEGEKIGEARAKLAVARNLLNQGIELNLISQATGLTLDELVNMQLVES